jgi:hypothetical protein
MTLETPANRADELPADAPQMQGGNGDGRVRLLSLHSIDRRCAAYRRVASLIAALEEDAGGHDQLSTGQRALIQRIAITAALAEDQEARWLSGEQIDPMTYCALGNALRRLLGVVGLRRCPKDVTPDDDADFARIFAEVEAEDAEEVTTP